MARKAVTSVIVLMCFILQSTVVQSIALADIGPNLLIIITASYGFMRGKKSGLLVGFFVGLLTDIFFGDVIGFFAVIYMYIGYANGVFRKNFFPEDVKLPLFLIVISDAVYGMTVYVLLFLLRGRFHVQYYLMRVVVPETIYTAVLTVFVYPVILKVNRAFDALEKRREKKFV